MRAAKYLFEHKLMCLGIIFLMFVGFTLGYMSPYISSKLVDVGIQKGGIEFATPIQLSNSQHEQLLTICSDVDYEELDQMYHLDDDLYLINDSSRDNLKNHNDQLLGYVIFMSDHLGEIVTKDQYVQWSSQYDFTYAQTRASSSVQALYSDSGMDTAKFQLDYLIFIGLLMLGFTVVCIIIGCFRALLSSLLSQTITRDKRRLIFDTIVDFSGKELSEFDENSLITRCSNDISHVQSMSMLILNNIVTAPVSAFVALVFAFNTAPQLLWTIFVAIFALAIAIFIVYRIGRPKFIQIQKTHDNLTYATRQVLSGKLVSRAYNNQEYEEERFDNANKQLYKIQSFVNRLTAVINPLMGLGYSVFSVIIFALGGVFVTYGTLQVGSIMAFSSYAASVVSSFASLGMIIGSLPRVTVSIDRIEEVLKTRDNKEKVIPYNDCIDLSDDYVSENGLGIKFENVTFSYSNDKNYAVENLNFEIKPKTNCAIIGTTGSGKSTIANLLLKIYQTSQGSIKINNIDVNTLNSKQVRNYYSYAPQDAFLFSGTVKNTVEFGLDDELSNDDIYKYLDMACAKEFVDNTPDGIEHELEQESNNLSGGQTQRLSLARTLARPANVYIFDDCFSALDFKTEHKVLKTIRNACKDKTSIFISQRISTVMNADQILVLDAGKIVGIGTHDELMKNCSQYIEIYKSQISDDNHK